MRKKRSSQIKKSVLDAMYEPVNKKQKRALLKRRREKAIIRAAKKNYHRNKFLKSQNPKIKPSKRQTRIHGIVS